MRAPLTESAVEPHAVHEDGLPLVAQLFDHRGGIGEDELEVRVVLGVTRVDQPELDVILGRNVGRPVFRTDATHRDDGIAAVFGGAVGAKDDAGLAQQRPSQCGHRCA